ncbi:MAG: hypothetical protein V4613_05895 [Bacteroidota bacterium]
MQVEVFKTNVKTKQEANRIVTLIEKQYPHSKVNFDLSDCDKILRITGNGLDVKSITNLVNKLGYFCAVLI